MDNNAEEVVAEFFKDDNPNNEIVQKTNAEKAGILVAQCNGNGSEIINVVAGLLGALDSEREKNEALNQMLNSRFRVGCE